VKIRTLGCKVNVYESEQILQSLEKTEQWRAASVAEVADLCIINSCTVTAEADRQTRQEIRRTIRDNPNAKVIVTGCYAQMDPDTVVSIPGVDLVLGNSRKLSLVEYVPDLMRRDDAAVAEVKVEKPDAMTGLPDKILTGFSGRSRAFLQIQQGCDQGCTFCIIHVARGASQSIPFTQLVQQMQKLVTAGFREIVICGVDLGSYGVDIDAGYDLTDLLSAMLKIPGDFRIRLGSLDPVHITDRLIGLLRDSSRICPHIHISMQSGSTMILKRMKRRYQREMLFERAQKLRLLIPDVVFSADIMAGFPTENDEHFADSLSAVEDLEICFPHVFPYSQRKGTPAARIPKQVPKSTRLQRAAALRELGESVTNRVLNRWIGRHQRVLLESVKPDGKSGKGRTDHYLPVEIHGENLTVGDFYTTSLNLVENGRLIGTANS
jgi:threonylcarbamoyladenosine tRNA methylthiotransferase MtaB